MDFICNIAKGRGVEFYHRVKQSDPTGSALLVVALAATGLAGDGVLQDADTLAAILSGSSNEVTNDGYARKALVAADLAAWAPDDANDRVDLDIPDQTWNNVLAGDGWAKLMVCYRPAPASPDSDVVPISGHDFLVTPDGTHIVAQIDAAGFLRAA
ncbi:hypothetical protein [Nonomuraea sp. LPB2021202275-12-8]|uniref:hypothetical protein n=1 Tax=Nonomuraea sp. LPB2021202275-12-8 TaxID=3120159 RepID=UPI00300D8474